MNTKKFLIVSTLIIAIGVGAWLLSSRNISTRVRQNQLVPETQQSKIPTGQAKNTTGIYTMDDVAKHTMKGDCWMVMDSVVYDMSLYKTHPGGEIIWKGCGKDATTLFETRPDGETHSDKARAKREEYKIGILSQ